MEAFLVAAWLVVAALLLGPPLLGVNRSTWPLGGASTAAASENEPRSASTEPAPTDPASTEPAPTEFAPTPVGRCRACGEDGQENYTYCRACLTPLPRPEEGAEPEREGGHPAD